MNNTETKMNPSTERPQAREYLFNFNRTLQSSEQPEKVLELFFKEAQNILQLPCTLEICEGSSLPIQTLILDEKPESDEPVIDRLPDLQIELVNPSDPDLPFGKLNVYSPAPEEAQEILTLYAQLVSSRFYQLQLEKENTKLLKVIQESKNRIALLNSIAHDLRTPLTSILGLSDLVCNLNDPIQIHPLARDISKQAKWLHQLLENILSLVRSENKFTIHPSIEIFQDIIEQVLDLLAGRLSTRKLEVIMPEDPVLVKVDIHLIEQVLVNVIENAIQHTKPDTRITLELSQEKNKAILQVKDEGKGIPEEHLDHLFDLYFTTRMQNKNRGTGLGLAISQSIIEKHNGSISGANRKDGQGAVFTIELPAIRLGN